MKTFQVRGFILISVLVFLGILSLVAYSSLNSALLQTKIARTWQERQRLFVRAETLLHLGERTLKNQCLNSYDCVKVVPLTQENDVHRYEVIANIKQDEQTLSIAAIYTVTSRGNYVESWKERSDD